MTTNLNTFSGDPETQPGWNGSGITGATLDPSQFYTAPSGVVFTSREVANQYGSAQGGTASAPASGGESSGGSSAPTSGGVPANLNSPAGLAYIAAHPETPTTSTSKPNGQGGFNQIDTSQPNPNTIQVQPGTSAVSNTDAQQAALAAAKASGQAPQDSSAGSAGVNQAIQSTTPPPANTQPTNSTPAVDNLFANNKTVQQNAQDLLDFLSPQSTTQQLTDQLGQIQTDKSVLAGLQTQLMNIDTIMNGTSDNIRAEVTAAGGFATESQVNALAVARNKTLLLQANEIQNKITTQQNIVATDTTLYGDEKSLADTQYNQRSSALQMAQAQADKITSAAQDNAKTIIGAVGYSGFVNSLLNTDPTGTTLAHTEQALGMAPGTLQNIASQEKSQTNLAQIQASGATTPYVVNAQGEVINTSTGYTYQSQDDFQQKTGMDTGTAGSKGLIQPLGLSLDQQTKIAQTSKAQTDAQYAGAIDQANINQSNASADASEASAEKTRSETQGTPNAPGYDANGQKYTNATAGSEIDSTIKSQNLAGGDGYIGPDTYANLESWWVQEGLSASDFKAYAAKYINPKNKADYL